MTAPVAELAKCLEGEARFIVFEGGDGTGKTTQVRLFAQVMADAGANVMATYEPGATELGASLRTLVMHGPEDVDARTEALLYATDRAYHVATVVRPALEAGTTVIEDRYIDSSVAYQGIGRGLGKETIRDLSLWATNNLLPDAVVVLDVDAETAAERLGGELDRLERAGADFHEKVRQHFLDLATSRPEQYVLVDAKGSVEAVFERIVRALVKLFS